MVVVVAVINDVVSLSDLPFITPVAVVVAATILRTLFKLPFFLSVAGVAAPLILPLSELPISKELLHLPRSYLAGGVWVSLLCGGFLWTLFRPAVSTIAADLGIVKTAYLALLGASLLVAALLVVNPAPLTRDFPGWKGPAGTILLATSCVCVVRAMWRMFRATALVALWGGVSLVLASSLFFDKLPHHVRRGDLHRIQSVISEESVSRVIAQLEVLSSRGLSVLGVLRVSELSQRQESDVDRANPLDV